MLEPDSVNTPEPFFIKPTDAALPFEICPLNVVEALFPPTVRTEVPAAPLVMFPAPAIDATVSKFALRSKVPVIVTAEPSGMTPSAPNFSVPALIFVGPLYVLSSDNIHVPAPTLVKVVTVEPIAIATWPPRAPPNVKA